MNTLLLVTGSRRLVAPAKDPSAQDIAAQRWAREKILESVQPLGMVDGEAWVLSGGAVGPDTWACEAATQYGHLWAVYRPSGERIDCVGSVTRWSPVPVHPLDRNKALVAAAARAAAQGWLVTVLAVLDPRSATGGTAQTVRCAREAGLEVIEETWRS